MLPVGLLGELQGAAVFGLPGSDEFHGFVGLVAQRLPQSFKAHAQPFECLSLLARHLGGPGAGVFGGLDLLLRFLQFCFTGQVAGGGSRTGMLRAPADRTGGA